MTFSLDTAKKQVIANMNLSVRDSATNVPTYSTALGDTSYSGDEITRACQSAATLVMQAICETDGHGERGLFVTETALTHGAVLPIHYGSIGVPRITPFENAGYTIVGKRKSIEEISAYRHNPNYFYSLTNHNLANGANPSKLAGFYAIDNNVFYFTGFSAVSDLATFTESSYTLLPDNRYPLVIDLSISKLKKDGDLSDIFSYYESQGFNEVNWIRSNKMNQPSMEKTVGNRDSGLK
jgi:hypothetical protein